MQNAKFGCNEFYRAKGREAVAPDHTASGQALPA